MFNRILYWLYIMIGDRLRNINAETALSFRAGWRDSARLYTIDRETDAS